MTRLKQFDILKGIGILAVLVGHIGVSGFPRSFIYGFHMPLFFFCSGVFYKNKPIGDVIISGIRQLLIPYLFFLTVYNIVSWSLLIFHGSSFFEAISVVLSRNNIINYDSNIYKTIWFLPCLFFVKVVYSLLRRFFKSGIVVFSITALLYFVDCFFLDTPLFGDTILCVLLFYCLGDLFSSIKNKFSCDGGFCMSIVLLGLYIFAVFILRPSIDLKGNIFPWYTVFLSCLGIGAFYSVSCLLAKIKNPIVDLLVLCGEGSLVVFGLHRALWLVLNVCLSKFELPYSIFALIQFVSALAVLLPVYVFLKNKCPFLVGRKSVSVHSS